MHKNHLNKGVLKGAMTQEEADAKFEAWLAEKEGKIQSKRDSLSKAQADAAAAAFKKEEERRAAIEKAVAEKNAGEGVAEDAEAAAEGEEAEAAEGAEEAVAEATEEAPAEDSSEENA